MKVDCGYTENYFKEKNRMTKNCEIGCNHCLIGSHNNGFDLLCVEFENTYPDKAIEIVQKWSDEHQVETRAEHFHPNARMRSGHPIGCKKCWDKPYIEGEF